MDLTSSKEQQLKAIFAALPEAAKDQLKSVFEDAAITPDLALPYDQLLGFLSTEDQPIDLCEVLYPASLLIAERAIRKDQLSLHLLQRLWSGFAMGPGHEILAQIDNIETAMHLLREHFVVWLRNEWEAENGKQKLRECYGKDVHHSVPILISILSYADEISELMRSWPKIITELSDEHLLPLRDLNDLLSENDPSISPYLLYLLKTRLRRPQEIFRAISKLTRQHSDLVLSKTDIRMVPDALFHEAEILVESFSEELQDKNECENLHESLRRFSGIISGSPEEFDIWPNGEWGKKLSQLSARAEYLWKKKFQKMWKKIDLATPRTQTKSFLGGSLTGPKLVEKLPTRVVDAARLSALELAQVFQFASRMGMVALTEKMRDTVEQRFREQENNFIDLLADPGEVDVDILQNHFAALVQIQRELHGDEEADILERRGIANAA